MDNVETTIAVADGQFESAEKASVQIKKIRTVEEVSYVSVESLNRDIADLQAQIDALEAQKTEKQELLKSVSTEAQKAEIVQPVLEEVIQ